MAVSLLILAFFLLARLSTHFSLGLYLPVNTFSAITAAAAFIISLIGYIWAPKKIVFISTLLGFLFISATAGLLVLHTGGYHSPFLALWVVVSIFSAILGWYGVVPFFIASLVYLIAHLLDHTLSRGVIVATILAGDIPLFISYLIWHTDKPTGEGSRDKAYRRLSNELDEVAGRSEVVINAIADGVIALNSQGIIELINPAAQEIIGWGRQDAISLNYKSVLKLTNNRDEELTPATDPVEQALTTNHQIIIDSLTAITNSGKKILVALDISPVGQIGSGVIVVFRDITKEKAEEREQAEFISTASHEMRTPVASIEGYLGLALNPATAQIDEKARDYITKAHESAQHLGRLFQDLLDVSKAEDGRLSNNPKVVDVVEITHDIVEGLTPKAVEKGLHVLFKPDPDTSSDNSELGERRLNPVYFVNLDNDHMREVIANIVENAIKYTPHGDVVIDVTGDSEHVVISVQDSGIGIPKEDIPHLFQKFYRVDNSDTREIGGTGLGLYLCRRLVEAMNGRLWVESEYQKGSTFFIELPRISHEEATRLIEAASMQIEQQPEIIPERQMLNPQPPITQPAPQIARAAPSQATVSAPIPAPIAPPAPEPYQQAPRPIPAQPRAATTYGPSAPVYQASTAPNTPLTAIEQNPNQYLQPRDGTVSIPPRE